MRKIFISKLYEMEIVINYSEPVEHDFIISRTFDCLREAKECFNDEKRNFSGADQFTLNLNLIEFDEPVEARLLEDEENELPFTRTLIKTVDVDRN